jgi:hypothetical protein
MRKQSVGFEEALKKPQKKKKWAIKKNKLKAIRRRKRLKQKKERKQEN